jgi:hypothetical protein
LAEVIGRGISERARLAGVTETMPGLGIEKLPVDRIRNNGPQLILPVSSKEEVPA